MEKSVLKEPLIDPFLKSCPDSLHSSIILILLRLAPIKVSVIIDSGYYPQMRTFFPNWVMWIIFIEISFVGCLFWLFFKDLNGY